MMSPSLPLDLWALILVRLEPKSILRCSSVSKSWYNLIKTSFFVSEHLNFNYLNNVTHKPCLLVRSCVNPREEIYEFCHDDLCLTKFVEFRAPFRAKNLFFRIVGCCNGLILLSDDFFVSYGCLILWNPFLGRSICVPEPKFVDLKHSFGFGFDPIRNDYKVVNVVDVGHEIVPPKVEIFRMSSRVWEEISDNSLAFSISESSDYAFVNGAAHWVGKGVVEGEVRNVVVVFDMVKERFRTIELPESLVTPPYNICVDAVVYMGSLAVVVTEDNENYCIWMMKEYGCVDSWTKRVSFYFYENLGRPFGFRGNGDVELMTTYGHWYAYETKGLVHFKFLGECEFAEPNLIYSFHACPYVQSLALLDKGADCDDAVTVQKLLLRHSRGNAVDDDVSGVSVTVEPEALLIQ